MERRRGERKKAWEKIEGGRGELTGKELVLLYAPSPSGTYMRTARSDSGSNTCRKLHTYATATLSKVEADVRQLTCRPP